MIIASCSKSSLFSNSASSIVEQTTLGSFGSTVSWATSSMYGPA